MPRCMAAARVCVRGGDRRVSAEGLEHVVGGVCGCVRARARVDACACVGFARDDELASALATATSRMPARVRVRACVHMDVSIY